MEVTEEDDDDLSLLRASANLLPDLEQSLPKVLYKHSKHASEFHIAHSLVRQKDLEHVIKLIEPFQGDPQLLDTRLKIIVPQIADALLQHLARPPKSVRDGYIDLTLAASTILYTLCKVRGRKIISGLLRNEPRYLKLIVSSLERHASDHKHWQIQFTLLLWLFHLLLAPFNLETISQDSKLVDLPSGLHLEHKLPDLAQRSLQLCLTLLSSPSVLKEVAALTLVRLVVRPDMQSLRLGDGLVNYFISELKNEDTDISQLHARLDMLRFMAGIAKSADLEHLLPQVFRACESIALSEEDQPFNVDAVGKKLVLKTMSAVVITSLRAASGSAILSEFLDESGALEDTIEYHIQRLADRESIVRHAAAKATSNIILSLDQSMAQEVLEALLSTLNDDIESGSDLQTANAFAWHGTTLALSYALFKRSVPSNQFPALIKVLLRALAFEQRTATGSVAGTNVRDAANFGLWSLARRSTTDELTRIDMGVPGLTVINAIALSLLQSACLDPVGNIRRGSSAALQELVGRHPNHIPEGIALVQVVDFVAVGLRQRGMIDVAASAMALDDLYWQTLMDGLMDWRGLGSADVASREYAALSIVQRLANKDANAHSKTVNKLIMKIEQCQRHDVERLHGLILTLALWIAHLAGEAETTKQDPQAVETRQLWVVLEEKALLSAAFEPRALRADLTVAIVKLITACCRHESSRATTSTISLTLPVSLPAFLEQLLSRSDQTLCDVTPDLICSLHCLDGSMAQYEAIELDVLVKHIKADTTKPILQGAARAYAIGASMKNSMDNAAVMLHITALQITCTSIYVDWRMVGFKALRVLLTRLAGSSSIDLESLGLLSKILGKGLRDYTIDQRGDIGSLVRVEAIDCARIVCIEPRYAQYTQIQQVLHKELARLSLEKLNRVRSKAAECRSLISGPLAMTAWTANVDSQEYFSQALAPLWSTTTPYEIRRALLEGLTSCAGAAAEHLLHNSRSVLSKALSTGATEQLQSIADDYVDLVKDAVAASNNVVPTLEVLAYLLQSRVLQRLEQSQFRWRNLLAVVQRAHYKSTDVTRLLAAVSIYSGLVDIASIRQDVLKKLFSMLKTIPYPKVRTAVAEVLFTATYDDAMKSQNWQLPASHNAEVLTAVQSRYITV